MRVWPIIIMLGASLAGANEVNWPRLLKAIGTVESQNDDSAINKKEQAYGRYQIRQGYLTDVNIRYGTSFTLADMHREPVARWVIISYMRIYGAKTHEQIARIHNGGPRGMYKAATATYWSKINDHL